MYPKHGTMVKYILRFYGCSSSSERRSWNPEVDDRGTIPRLELPGKLNEWTGTVMYPNDDSALWDVDGRKPGVFNAHYTCALFFLSLSLQLLYLERL